MKVLVTDGGSRAALAVTRSLGRAGHEVMVGEKRAPALAHASRYCHRRLVYPDPARASGEFVTWLADVVRDEGVEVLMPIADISMSLATHHRERLGTCAVPFPSADVVDRAADKVDVYLTASRLGLPVPRSSIVTSAQCIPDEPLEFPLVVKPSRSRTLTAGGWAASAVSFPKDRGALEGDLRSRPPHDFPVLVQERIIGPGVGVFVCVSQGRPLALFSHRRIREQPPWGGVAVLSESVPLDPVARDAALKLLDAVGWRDGAAMVEFKRDDRDGSLKVMEINGRFWGSLQLAIDAGVDFPLALLQTTQGELPSALPSYRHGVRCRWLWGDVDSLWLVLVGRASAMGVTRSRMSAVLDFLRIGGRDVHYENPRWDDLGPWILETRQRLWPISEPTA